jgi:basic membrane protein A
VLAASCAPAGTSERVVRLGMVTDVGGLGDHSYNDAAYAGMLAAKQKLGVHIAVLQPESAAEFPPMLGSFADRGYDETFAVGYTMQVDLRETAERIPDRHFSIIDAVVDEPNVTSVTFKEEEGSFLAGAIAAMTTKTHVLGFLGGADVPLIRKFVAGFAAGAHEVDPSIRIASKYVGNFNDVATGAELTGIMFDDGADIVYTAAGKAGLGAIQLVRQRKNDFVIGVNSDQDALAPGKILTSMLKRVDVSVYKIAELAAAHKTRPTRLELGVRENGVGLTDFRYTRNVVTPAMIARLARIKAAIIDGRIVVPKTDADAAAFKRVPL